MATRGSQCITPKTYQLEVQSRRHRRDEVILNNANCSFYGQTKCPNENVKGAVLLVGCSFTTVEL